MAIQSSFREFIYDIVKAVQSGAARISDFDNGAIRIALNPLCEEANEWTGCFNFGGSKCELEFVFPVKPGASHTRPAGWRGRDIGIVNCYGYSALKVAGASYARSHGQGNCSDDARFDAWPDDWTDEEHGLANGAGAVCYEVQYVVLNIEDLDNPSPSSFDSNKPFMRLSVCVSGADALEDKHCASQAEPVIDAWCQSETLPCFPGNRLRSTIWQGLFIKA